jgi:hypothetical protein
MTTTFTLKQGIDAFARRRVAFPPAILIALVALASAVGTLLY